MDSPQMYFFWIWYHILSPTTNIERLEKALTSWGAVQTTPGVPLWLGAIEMIPASLPGNMKEALMKFIDPTVDQLMIIAFSGRFHTQWCGAEVMGILSNFNNFSRLIEDTPEADLPPL